VCCVDVYRVFVSTVYCALTVHHPLPNTQPSLIALVPAGKGDAEKMSLESVPVELQNVFRDNAEVGRRRRGEVDQNAPAKSKTINGLQELYQRTSTDTQESLLGLIRKGQFTSTGKDSQGPGRRHVYVELDAFGVLLASAKVPIDGVLKLVWIHMPTYGPSDERKQGQPRFFHFLREQMGSSAYANIVLAGENPRSVISAGGLPWPTVRQWELLQSKYHVPNHFHVLRAGDAYFFRRSCYHMIRNVDSSVHSCLVGSIAGENISVGCRHPFLINNKR
jgi:hypothetical protein